MKSIQHLRNQFLFEAQQTAYNLNLLLFESSFASNPRKLLSKVWQRRLTGADRQVHDAYIASIHMSKSDIPETSLPNMIRLNTNGFEVNHKSFSQTFNKYFVNECKHLASKDMLE